MIPLLAIGTFITGIWAAYCIGHDEGREAERKVEANKKEINK